ISWKKAMDGIKTTDGWVTQVTEQEIADAKAIIGRDGIGCEPASAVTVAGLKKIVKEGTDVAFDKNETVVAILTGHILKDPDYTVRYHRGELYEEFVTQTQVIHKAGPIKSNFANKPIFVEADEEKLKQIISNALKTY
ncbi:MAG: threonine synthase, partial [Patescibacteria group bacterium]